MISIMPICQTAYLQGIARLAQTNKTDFSYLSNKFSEYRIKGYKTDNKKNLTDQYS
jgi:hypothetical protein